MAYFLLLKSKVLEQYNKIKQICDIVSYSVKTNVDVSKILAKNTDCLFSIHHIKYAKMFPADKIVFFIAGDSQKQISNYIKQRVTTFVVDNVFDYSTLKKVITKIDKQITVFLRMKLKEHTLHSEKHFVFGLSSEKINEFVSELSSFPNITVGIHVHRKTQNIGEWGLISELENNLTTNTLEKLKYFCSGGGYPIVYKNFQTDVSSEIFEKLKDLKMWLNERSIKLITEPGRFIAGPSCELVAKIISIYDNTITIDCSIYNCAMDTYVTNTRLQIKGETEFGFAYMIKGKTPDSIDIFRYKVFFAKKPKVGDKIIFENAGAYTYATNLFGLTPLKVKVVY